MKQVFAAILTAFPLLAAGKEGPIEARWTDVCRIANQRELTLKTRTGESVEGYCVAIDVNRVSIRSNGNAIIGVARSTLAKIEVTSHKDHQLRSLQRSVHHGLKWSVRNVLTPVAPVAIVSIPITLAWGASASPFCLLGDLLAIGSRKREIRIIPDPND